MPRDPYDDFAERYDWMMQKDPERERFFRDLFTRYSVNSVLDCACGTGHDLVLFKSFGCHVQGSDISEAMLAQARKNFEKSETTVPVFQLDYRDLDSCFHSKFDAVVCLSNAINEILEDAETFRALNSMKSIIRTGGILVFDQGQSDAMMVNPPRFDPVANNRDFSRLFLLDYSQHIMLVEVFDFIHTEARTDFKHSSFQVRIRLKDGWDQILEKVGFSKIEYFGDWDFTPYDKSFSKRLIVVCQK